jgi:hypothetical protein
VNMLVKFTLDRQFVSFYETPKDVELMQTSESFKTGMRIMALDYVARYSDEYYEEVAKMKGMFR